LALPRPGPSRGFRPAERGYNKAGTPGVPTGLLSPCVPASFSYTIVPIMPRDGALILSEVRVPVLSVVCEPCARRGVKKKAAPADSNYRLASHRIAGRSRTKSNESPVNARKGATKRFLVRGLRVFRVFAGFLGFTPRGSIVDCIF
jgi:hypothetical protein